MDISELNYVRIGQRIRAARKEMGWPQAELAFRAGLNSAYMSHIETGQTKLALPTIVKIANALSVSVDDLLCDNLVKVQHVYDKKIADELADCNANELEAFYEILKVTKKALRQCSSITT